MGNVRSLHPTNFMKNLTQYNQEYFQVCLKKEKERQRFPVHRVVAEAFIPNPLGVKYVNHLNGKKHDNRVENLEWCTAQQNCLHAFAMGLNKPLKGEKNPNAKLTEKEVRFIRYIKGLYPQITTIAISNFFGISTANVSDIWNFNNWKEVK